MRFDIDSFREIGDALVRNKSRSLLTGFGIFWGLFMLLFMMGGGQGLKYALNKSFDGFASNTVVIFASQTSKPSHGFKEGRSWVLNSTDVARLKTMIPELDIVTPEISSWGLSAVYDTYKADCHLKGIYPDEGKVEIPFLKYGRFINEIDCQQERKVCVIGKRIYNSLFPEGGDPCGKYIKINDIHFQIVGVDFKEGSISINGSSDETATIPLPVIQNIYNRGDAYDMLAMTGKKGVKMSELEGRIRQVMARKHLFDPSDKQALYVLNSEELFQLADNLLRGVSFLIWLVGLGTILAGAIGVSNIMMVTVKERTTEIGIRRAIGATPKEILSQIIMESISLTLVAGSAGIVFSVQLLNLLEKIVNQTEIGFTPFQISFGMALLCTALLAILGAAAGLAPALRAMKIKPVDAMRDE
ncbi:MAG: ABC transporter permease [Bacteroidales bacterium]|nr:ABC transporter permease [Bacteroidales bacterium]